MALRNLLVLNSYTALVKVILIRWGYYSDIALSNSSLNH